MNIDPDAIPEAWRDSVVRMYAAQHGRRHAERPEPSEDPYRDWGWSVKRAPDRWIGQGRCRRHGVLPHLDTIDSTRGPFGPGMNHHRRSEREWLESPRYYAPPYRSTP